MYVYFYRHSDTKYWRAGMNVLHIPNGPGTLVNSEETKINERDSLVSARPRMSQASELRQT